MARSTYKDPCNVYLNARLEAGYNSRGKALDAGLKNVMSERTLAAVEMGEASPSCMVVAKMIDQYGAPLLGPIYRQECCPFKKGQLVVLNAISTHFSDIANKLEEEFDEVQPLMPKLRRLMINKLKWSDYSEEDKAYLFEILLELIDTKHTINVLLTELEKLFDTKVLYEMHNQKCLEKGYFTKEKTAQMRAVR